MAGPGTFISVGKSLGQAVERVGRAEALGYDSAYVTHIAARDSLSVLMAYAAGSERIKLGTGVLPIYSRTPVATAQQAATIDEYSGGRMVLGLGVSHKVTVENWYQTKLERPLQAMREYVGTLRACFAGTDPPQGEIFTTNFRFMGYQPRADLPIYVAALSPNMLRLAGEVADGVMLWLCNPDYIRDVVVPEVTAGRKRAGKDLEGFDVVAAVPAAVAEEKSAAYEVMRSDLVTYWSLPFYRAMIERSGFGEDIEAFDAGIAAGDVERAKAAISDRFLANLTAIGSPEEVRSGVERYVKAGTSSPCIGPVPRTDFESTLEVAAPAHAGAAANRG
jgi:alkanesulfonate monooxygenase SsuD/methylene tetrahydromethanopterin reductase-like flavin-dependent oxidoreductase (luciferase family)